MIRIEHNNIHITRGDPASFFVEIGVYDGGELPDYLTMTVKDSVNDDGILFQEGAVYDIDDGGFTVYIAEGDTEKLEYGDYVYDLECLYEDGYRMTVLEPHLFEVRSEVTI